MIAFEFKGTLGGFHLDASFDAPATGVTALFGPSGSGKTTILRAIAGLERLPGRLTIGEDVWQSPEGVFLETHRRSIGYVFQEPSLFPHLSVRKNLVYGERRAIRPLDDPIRFDDIVGLMGIERLLDRTTVDLSGGERQRVAIGRALLARPRLLLMDEPLAALDRRSKDEILPYLETLHEDLEIPILYVSHDLSEVERLADRLVLVDDGRVVASGELADVLTQTHLPIVQRPDAAVVLDARVLSFDEGYDLTELEVGGAALWAPGRIGEAGSARRVRIAAADVSLASDRPSPTSILNVLAGRIERIDPIGAAQVNVLVTIGSDETTKLLARVSRKAQDTLGLAPRQPVFAQIKAVSLVASGAREG